MDGMKRYFKRAFGCFALLGVLFSLCGCACGEISLRRAHGLTKVTVQIDGAAVPYYAPLYVAKEKGYFAREGLDVSFIYADASTVLKNVAVGNVEFGFPNGDSVVSAIANGVPIGVVHTTYQQGIGAILSLEGNVVRKPADLKGKTVAVTGLGSPNFVQLQALAAKNGFSLRNDLTLKTVGTSAITQALQGGEADAIIFSRVRYFAMKNKGVPVHEIPLERYFPSYGNVLVANRYLIDRYPQTVRGFIRALDASLSDLTHGKLAGGVKIAMRYAPGFKGEEKQVLQTMNELFVGDLWQSDLTRRRGFGFSDPKKWQSIADLQYRYGLIDTPVKMKDYVFQPDYFQAKK